MATSNNSLRVAELDFNSIKTNLKNYLKNQNTFQDYDYEGSGMSVLLDLLAYNTYYNSFYLNMIANEAFLDTAQDRKNILSHAKVINYVPSSMRAAESVLNLRVTPSLSENQNINYIILNKYTRLLGADVNGRNYPFVAINANTSYKDNGSFAFANVHIKQGEVITRQFTIGSNNTSRRYQIPSSNIDTGTLIVTVQESTSNTSTEQFFVYSDITELTANTPVYFIEEDHDLNYTIYFGDDVLGKKPANSNIVQVTYLDTLGPIANNITKYSFVDPVAGLFRDNVSITSIQGSYGGGDKENIEAIRFRAPVSYAAQNRCVTVKDYKALLTKDFPNVEAVSVWGGEDNDPIVYGKVYLSIKTRGYYILTNLEKENIKNALIRNRNVITVQPEIIDPEFIFLIITGTVNYNPNLTTLSENQIFEKVKDAIYRYSQDNLYTFESTFILSKLQQYIESCDGSIVSSDVTIFLQNRKKIITNFSDTYTINYNTPLRKGDYLNKLYTYPQVRVYDAQGTLREVFIEETPESFTGVDSIGIINAGFNYTATPIITISGDGIGATATALVVNGKIRTVTITNVGINYTRATATITDGSGSEASLTVYLKQNYGTLRTYYFDSTGAKIFINNEAGTINYLSGKVTLSNLFAVSVVRNPYYDEKILTVNIVPESGVISPLRNRLLAIDTNNAQAVQLKMVPVT